VSGQSDRNLSEDKNGLNKEGFHARQDFTRAAFISSIEMVSSIRMILLAER